MAFSTVLVEMLTVYLGITNGLWLNPLAGEWQILLLEVLLAVYSKGHLYHVAAINVVLQNTAHIVVHIQDLLW
jgi:hypothetical protein